MAMRGASAAGTRIAGGAMGKLNGCYLFVMYFWHHADMPLVGIVSLGIQTGVELYTLR